MLVISGVANDNGSGSTPCPNFYPSGDLYQRIWADDLQHRIQVGSNCIGKRRHISQVSQTVQGASGLLMRAKRLAGVKCPELSVSALPSATGTGPYTHRSVALNSNAGKIDHGAPSDTASNGHPFRGRLANRSGVWALPSIHICAQVIAPSDGSTHA